MSEFQTRSILYLEDELLIAFDVSSFLRDAGFSSVQTAHRLREARAAADETRFDIALLDINVDRSQNSLELGAELKAKGTLVIFASGNGTDCASLQRDGYHVIDKPFSHGDLEATMVAALREAA
ncbi:MAG: response regulator [Pseudomonadota bacterium]